MVLRLIGGPLRAIDDVLRRRQVGIADPEADDIDALGLDFFFEAIEFGEEVRWEEA